MVGLYFEDYHDGWSYETGEKTIEESMVATFVELCEFTSPTYVNADYAMRHYAGRLVPGVFVLALAEGLFLRDGITFERGIFLLELTPKFLNPAYVGDVIRNRLTLTSKRLTSKGDRGVVVCEHEVLNRKDEVLVRYGASRMIRTRDYGMLEKS